MFRFDSETSACPLLGADLNQCLQTSSNFLNQITSAAKDWRSLQYRDSTACSESSSHCRCLIVAVFSPDRRRLQPHRRQSSASLIAGAPLSRIQPTDPDFSRVLLYSLFQQSADVKKQTVFFLQTADVWSTSSAAEACRCGPQTADVLVSKKQTPP
ncbi:hypothetical protein LXL04_007430 [Taraxacum kok-saghyz]